MALVFTLFKCIVSLLEVNWVSQVKVWESYIQKEQFLNSVCVNSSLSWLFSAFFNSSLQCVSHIGNQCSTSESLATLRTITLHSWIMDWGLDIADALFKCETYGSRQCFLVFQI